MHPTSPRCAIRNWGIEAFHNCRTAKNHPEQTQRVSAKVWGILSPRIYGAPCRGILPRMTRHKHAHIGLGTPSPLDHWINATLRMLAMLVLHVASTFRMKARRSSVNATPTMPRNLPARTNDTHQETNTVPQDSPIALILRSAAKLRVSKDEGVLTTTCHPGNAKRYPGPIVRARHPINGSRRSLRSAGMTIVDEAEAQQHARPHNNAPPHSAPPDVSRDPGAACSGMRCPGSRLVPGRAVI